MARLTCSVRVVQLRIESRLWMEKLEDQLMSASGKLQRGMRWPVKVRFGPFVSFALHRALTRVGHVRWVGCEVPRRPRARASLCRRVRRRDAASSDHAADNGQPPYAHPRYKLQQTASFSPRQPRLRCQRIEHMRLM